MARVADEAYALDERRVGLAGFCYGVHGTTQLLEMGQGSDQICTATAINFRRKHADTENVKRSYYPFCEILQYSKVSRSVAALSLAHFIISGRPSVPQPVPEGHLVCAVAAKGLKLHHRYNGCKGCTTCGDHTATIEWLHDLR